MKTIFTNYNYDEYMEDAEEKLLNQMEEYEEEGEPSEDEIYEEAAWLCEDDWCYYVRPGLENYFSSNPCIVTGSVGLWDGRHRGGLVIQDIRDFDRLITDCDYVELIKDDDGHLNMRASHHDGTNYYEIKRLTDAGYEYYCENNYILSREELCETLFNNEMYSELPETIDYFI